MVPEAQGASVRFEERFRYTRGHHRAHDGAEPPSFSWGGGTDLFHNMFEWMFGNGWDSPGWTFPDSGEGTFKLCSATLGNGTVNGCQSHWYRAGNDCSDTDTTVGRALVTLEGLLDEFIPDVNMIQIISDHIASSTSKKDFAKDETKSLALESHQALHSLLAAANELKVASRMLTRGQLRVNMEMVGSQEPIHLLANMVNRLTMALIVVGLFIGSSIVYYAGIKPVIFGIPIVGFLGYVIAFILSVWIVFDIYFKGRDSKKR